MQKLILNFSLKKREIEAEEHISDCKKIVSHLQSFDALYKSANVVDTSIKKNYFFNDDLSDFNISKLKLIIDEQKDISYTNLDGSKELTAKSKSWMGFSTVIFFGGEGVDSVPEITLHIAQGSIGNVPSFLKLEYAFENQNKLSEEYITDLICKIVDVTEVTSMNAITSQFFLKVRKKGQYAIGWMNYTTDKKIETFLSPQEKKMELKDGVIFCISSKVDFMTNKQAVIERSIEISDFLRIT